MTKTLVFFTSGFPFGKGEAFIESEFPFLCKAFDRIIIVTNEMTNAEMRAFPANVIIVRFPYAPSFPSKTKAVFSVFSPIFRGEIKFIKEKLQLKFTRSILNTLLGSIAKGIETRDFILHEIVKKYSLDFSNTWFYSYWMNDMAIGLAMLKKDLPQAKTFCRVHRWDLYFYANANNYLPLRIFLLNHLNKCFSISEDGKRYLTNLLGDENTRNVEVARLGTFAYKKSLKPAQANTFLIVSCSTLTPPKRVDIIAAALSKISSLKIKWLHFGDGILRQKIEEEAKKNLSENKNIEYAFMGNRSNNELLKFYSENKFDAFINVSSSEGIPVSIMEAMSFGIPVIATAAGGTTEIVRDNYNGFLLDVADTSDKISETLAKFFSFSAEEKNQFAQNAFETWNENYNAEKNYRKFTESILSI